MYCTIFCACTSKILLFASGIIQFLTFLKATGVCSPRMHPENAQGVACTVHSSSHIYGSVTLKVPRQKLTYKVLLGVCAWLEGQACSATPAADDCLMGSLCVLMVSCCYMGVIGGGLICWPHPFQQHDVCVLQPLQPASPCSQQSQQCSVVVHFMGNVH